MRKQNREPRFVQDVTGESAEHDLAHAAVSVGAHHEQVALERECTVDDTVWRCFMLAWNVFGARRKAMTPERGSNVFRRAKSVFDFGRSFAR